MFWSMFCWGIWGPAFHVHATFQLNYCSPVTLFMEMVLLDGSGLLCYQISECVDIRHLYSLQINRNNYGKAFAMHYALFTMKDITAGGFAFSEWL